MTEYVWHAPAGAYNVPESFRRLLEREFPGYRVRWSLRDSCWHLEQPCGNSALVPFRIDPSDDTLIRARDGFWLVMKIQPGDRMPCPNVVERFPRQICNWTLKVPQRKVAEVRCPVCAKAGRDGRAFAGFWPLDEGLIEELRRTDPLKGGTAAARATADASNKLLLAEAERKLRDATTSLDAVDYRWIAGIPSSTGLSRRTIAESDLL